MVVSAAGFSSFDFEIEGRGGDVDRGNLQHDVVFAVAREPASLVRVRVHFAQGRHHFGHWVVGQGVGIKRWGETSPPVYFEGLQVYNGATVSTIIAFAIEFLAKILEINGF